MWWRSNSKRDKSQPEATERVRPPSEAIEQNNMPALDEAESRALFFQELSHITAQWQFILDQALQQMRRTDIQLPKMLSALLGTCVGAFEGTAGFFAVAPFNIIEEAMYGSLKIGDIVDSMLVVTAPEIDETDSQAILYYLSRALRYSTSHVGKRWRTVKSLSVADQTFAALQQGECGIFSPLHYNGSLIGLIFLLGPTFDQRDEYTRAHGEGVMLLVQLLSYWIEQKLNTSKQLLQSPQSLQEEIEQIPLSEDDVPIDPAIEQANLINIQSDQSQLLLRELAAYSQFAMLRSTEFHHLVKQACVSLLHICNADCVAFLSRTSQGTFRVESIEMKRWSWSRDRVTADTSTAEHPMYDKAAFQNWPDLFVRIVNESRRPIRLNTDEELKAFAPRMRALGFRAVLVRPVLIKGQCHAIIMVGTVTPRHFSDQTEAVISSVAAMSAMSMANRTRQNRTTVSQENDSIPTSVQSAYELLRAHRVRANHHPDELKHYAYQIAEQLHLSQTEIWNISVAAMICDLGMLTVPHEILNKSTKLTSDEWEKIQQHPITSEALLRGYDECDALLPIVRHHHERWDGSGYPDHLTGEEIPLGARVLAVADTFVSMQTAHAYRTHMTSDAALKQIKELSGSLFDPDVVSALEAVCALEQAA
jgi:response regulator RpfG family c-di-GMP phosphodiesterase